MRRLLLTILVAVVAAHALPATAQVNDDPTVDGTTGLFVVPRASTLEEGTWSLGASYYRLAREEGDSQVTSTGFMGAYGLSDRLEFFLAFQPHVKISRRFTAEEVMLLASRITGPCCPRVTVDIPLSGLDINEHPFAIGDSHSGVGDLVFGAKYKFLGDSDDYSGMALQAWIKAPTGEYREGIGTGRVDIGGRLIASLEAADLIGWNAYAGYVYRDTPKIDRPVVRYVLGEPQVALPSAFPFFVSPEILYGIGFQIPSRGTFQLVGEWIGSVTVRDMNGAYTGGDDQSILQWGTRATFENGLALNFAANFSSQIGVRFPELQQDTNALSASLRRWGFLASASYSTSRREPLLFAGTSPVDLPLLNSAPTLTCRAERTTIRAGESVRLIATANDPDNDPLTVSWSASAGSLSASTGTEVTWDSTGVPAGTGPVRARVSDGYGGTADCEIRVTVEEPPPPAEPTELSFVCSEFPSGNTRIDNRCKAVLDDVALQLRQNPGATATIVGHSDSAGSATVNDRTAMERADNAKAYLVETHGIDSSRMTASSAGSTMPMADNGTRAGRAMNRRIEIVVTIPPR